jgi:hypothetical protein
VRSLAARPRALLPHHAPHPSIAEASDVKAIIAAIHFILSSSGTARRRVRVVRVMLTPCAAKFDVQSDVLLSELMQLGLPQGASCSAVAFQR